MAQISYANKGVIRDKKLQRSLEKIIAEAARRNDISKVVVASGGQIADHQKSLKDVPGGWTGSDRHDHGNAADVDLYDKNGKKLDFNNPQGRAVIESFLADSVALGAPGIGAGPGYMRGQGRVHVGFGTPKAWGAGGKAVNAPGWVKDALSKGIKAFQAANGLTVDGIPGPQTLAAYVEQQQAPAFAETPATPPDAPQPRPQLAQPSIQAPSPALEQHAAARRAVALGYSPEDERAAAVQRAYDIAIQAQTNGSPPEVAAQLMERAQQLADGLTAPASPAQQAISNVAPAQPIASIAPAQGMPSQMPQAQQTRPMSMAPAQIQKASAVPGSMPSFGALGPLGLTAEGRIANSTGMGQPGITPEENAARRLATAHFGEPQPMSIGPAQAMPQSQATASARSPIQTPQTIDPAQAMQQSQTQARQVNPLEPTSPTTSLRGISMAPSAPQPSAPRDIDAEVESARKSALDWAIRTATSPGVSPEVAQQAAATAERLASTAPSPKPPAAPPAPAPMGPSIGQMGFSASPELAANKPAPSPMSINPAVAMPSSQTQATASGPVNAPASYPPQARPDPASLGVSQPMGPSLGELGFANSPEVASRRPFASTPLPGNPPQPRPAYSTPPVARPNPVELGFMSAPGNPPQARPATPAGPSLGMMGFAGSPEMAANKPTSTIPLARPTPPSQMAMAPQAQNSLVAKPSIDSVLDQAFDVIGTHSAPGLGMGPMAQAQAARMPAPTPPPTVNSPSSMIPTVQGQPFGGGVPTVQGQQQNAPQNLLPPGGLGAPPPGVPGMSMAPAMHKGLGAPYSAMDLAKIGGSTALFGAAGLAGSLAPRAVNSVRNLFSGGGGSSGGMGMGANRVSYVSPGVYSANGRNFGISSLGDRITSNQHAAMLDAGQRARSRSGSSGNDAVDRERERLSGVGGLF